MDLSYPPEAEESRGLAATAPLTRVNAGIGYAWRWNGRRMSVDLMGKNLRDEKYRPSQSTRGRPREFQLTYVARF